MNFLTNLYKTIKGNPDLRMFSEPIFLSNFGHWLHHCYLRSISKVCLLINKYVLPFYKIYKCFIKAVKKQNSFILVLIFVIIF